MLMAHGFLRRLFEVFERHRTSVDVVTTSEVSVSVTVDDTRRLPEIVETLRGVAEVTREDGMAIVCAVGEGLQGDPRVRDALLEALGGVPLRMVSQAASRRNITFVLRDADLPRALDARARALLCGEARHGAMRILLLGHGRMGQLVERLRRSTAARSRASSTAGRRRRTRSTLAAARRTSRSISRRRTRWRGNVPALARAGSTSSSARPAGRSTRRTLRAAAARRRHRRRSRRRISRSACTCSGWSSRRRRVVSRSAADVGAWIHEAHHAAKKDAPSGTALLLERAMEEAGYPRPIDVSSTRAGSIPGTHTVGFDGPAETVTLTHTARDRAVFARGALEAAKWWWAVAAGSRCRTCVRRSDRE